VEQNLVAQWVRQPAHRQSLRIERLCHQGLVAEKEDVPGFYVRRVGTRVDEETLLRRVQRPDKDSVVVELTGKVGSEVEVMLAIGQELRPAMARFESGLVRFGEFRRRTAQRGNTRQAAKRFRGKNDHPIRVPSASAPEWRVTQDLGLATRGGH